MTVILRTCSMLFLISLLGVAQAANIGTWNVKRMSLADEKDYYTMAHVITRYDAIALQEVMDNESLDTLIKHIKIMSKEDWGVIHSHRIGRGSYKEIYAFLYRKSVISYVDGAVVYLDKGDVFARDPFSARFKVNKTGQMFTMANIHVLYGKSSADRLPEIRHLTAYWTWLESLYPDTPIYLMGDFNLEPTNTAYHSLKEHAKPLLNHGATTLSYKAGVFVSLYDNIWTHRKSTSGQASVVDFPMIYNLKHRVAIKTISDHLPVIVKIN